MNPETKHIFISFLHCCCCCYFFFAGTDATTAAGYIIDVGVCVSIGDRSSAGTAAAARSIVVVVVVVVICVRVCDAGRRRCSNTDTLLSAENQGEEKTEEEDSPDTHHPEDVAGSLEMPAFIGG